jgi:hypothetical protein
MYKVTLINFLIFFYKMIVVIKKFSYINKKLDMKDKIYLVSPNFIEEKIKISFQFLEHIGKRPYQRVQDNLKDFIGREWIVDEIFNWLESDQR